MRKSNEYFRQIYRTLDYLIGPVETDDFYCDFRGDFKRNFTAIWNRLCTDNPAESPVHERFEMAAKSRLKTPLKSQQKSSV